MNSNSSPASHGRPQTVYLDLTHLGRHVTGIERIAIELFEKQTFEGAVLKPVRSKGTVSMILMQQIWLPLLALFNPSAKFVFPGFPPSPLFVLARNRTYLYVHDLFLVTRRQDLSRNAKLYMAWPFRVAVTRLRNFMVNSEKTRGELAPFIKPDASIALYRPSVRNVFDLSAQGRDGRQSAPSPVRIVSVGTVEPRKNYGAAARIVARINELHPGGAELHIVGRSGWGPDAEVLAASPHVTVHGFLSAIEAKRVIESADVYLCTSHDEGLGLPLLEVQYAGVPVVAPDKPVFREVLGTSAAFIDPSQPDDAAAQILALLSRTDWRARSALDAIGNVARWNSEAVSDVDRAKQMFAKTAHKAACGCAAHSAVQT
jgi:glycosyltransferase involved in cell wall biosynthesis